MSRFVYLFFSVAFCVSLFAQGAGGGAAGQSQPQQQQPVYQEDGGTTEILQSIFIPPKMHAPFSLTLHTEWVKTLSDGNTITLMNQRHIYRDSRGRIFQERVVLVPKTGKYVPYVTTLQYADPNAHAVFNCFQDNRHRCVQLPYDATTDMNYQPVSPKPGPLPDGMGNGEHEDLGKQFIEGVETVGTRDRVTYSPGVFGNDAPMTVEHETVVFAAAGNQSAVDTHGPAPGQTDVSRNGHIDRRARSQPVPIAEGVQGRLAGASRERARYDGRLKRRFPG